MLELLLGWVTKKAGSLIFKTIFSEDFVKDLIKDYGKDFCKYLPGQLGNLASKPFQQEPVQKAVAMALIEFLKLVQQQLKIRCKLNDDDIKAYTQDIKKFISDKTVKENLGKAFDINCEDLEAEVFKQSWWDLHLKLLPQKFNWQSVVEQYLLKVQENISESEELRYIIELQKLTSIDKNIQEIAGVSKDFDLRKYQEAIRERYINLKLDSLDTDGSSYNRLGLWDVFIPQNAREIHQVLPELPREYLKQLQESNQLDAGINLERIEAVLRLIAGMIDAKFVEKIIQYLISIDGEENNFVNLFLAADCLAEVRNRKAILSISKQLLSELKKLINYGIYRTSVFSVRYSQYAEEDNSIITKVRIQAVKTIANAWKDDPDILNWLKEATTNDDRYVRGTALQELARGFRDYPDCLAWLKQLASNDNDWGVRCTAVRELVYNWKDDPNTLTWLKQVATTDYNKYVRLQAVGELVRNWKNNSDVFSTLEQLTTTDDDTDVRAIALQEIACSFKDDPDTLTIFKQATTDYDIFARRTALEKIARGFKDDPDTLNILKQATTDNDEDVRRTAEKWLKRLQQRNQK